MTELDDALAGTRPEAVTAISVAAPRRHRHRWVTYKNRDEFGPPTFEMCDGCGIPKVLVAAASRRGRQVRNYGNRAELDVARTYGGRKVGHGQGPTDVVGKTRKLQVKTRRSAPPAMWRAEFAKLDRERDGRLALLLLRFVRPGNLGPEDFFVIRGRDLLEWWGTDAEP